MNDGERAEGEGSGEETRLNFGEEIEIKIQNFGDPVRGAGFDRSAYPAPPEVCRIVRDLTGVEERDLVKAEAEVNCEEYEGLKQMFVNLEAELDGSYPYH